MTPSPRVVVSVLAHVAASRRQLRTARQLRDELLWQIVDSGVPKRQVGRHVRGLLEQAGWTAEQVAEVGVSDGAVAQVLWPSSARRG